MNTNGPAVAAGGATARCLGARPPQPLTARGEVDLGPLDDISPGQGRAYVVGGRIIAVFRERDGRLFAIDNHCPHRGGSLADGIVGDGTVICPLHGWKIELGTGRCPGEAAAVHAYAVRLVDGHVWLSVAARPRGVECTRTP